MSATEDFDRQQAFAAGFALAARDMGLSKPEYEAMCKRAADMTEIAPVAPPPAPPTAPPAPIVPITDPDKQGAQIRADNFAKEKAQQVQGQAAPQQKAAAVSTHLGRAAQKPAALATAPSVVRPPRPPPVTEPAALRPPRPPPVADVGPPPSVLPMGKSVFDPAYADAVTKWEAAQRPQPQKAPRHDVPPTPTNRLAEALRGLMPEGW